MKKIIILILHLLLLSSCKIEVSNSVSVNSNTSIISSLSTSSENSSLSTSSSPVINENCECKECFYCLLKFTIDDIISIKMSEAIYYSSSIKIKEEFYEEVLGMVNVKYSKIEYNEQYMLDSSPNLAIYYNQGDYKSMTPFVDIYFNRKNFKMYLIALKLDWMYESKETFDVDKIEEFEDKCNAHWE